MSARHACLVALYMLLYKGYGLLYKYSCDNEKYSHSY